MTLQEFLTEQRYRLEAFESFWEECQQDKSIQAPSDMNPGDWDEQFAIFEESE